MQIKRIMSLILAAVLLFSLSGCRNRGDENQNSTPEVMEEDELVIYHNNSNLAQGLMAITEEYSKATGKKVTAKLSGSNLMGDIETNGAALYVVDTKSDLSGMHSGGFFMDLLNDIGFSNVITGIPAGLQLNNTGLGSYGIPLMLEGYGYIVDLSMLRDIFGEESVSALVSDLKTCSFTDFEGFVAAVDTYIDAPSAAKVKINENEYTFAKEKTGKAQNLTGVFSLNFESAEAAKALLSTAFGAKFAGRYEVLSADENMVTAMDRVFAAFIESLDLHTKYIAGAEGSISRGEEFSGGDYNYSTAVDLFTRGHALFYPGGTSDAEDFEKSSAGFGAELDIIPMKLPLSDEDITASGQSLEKLNRSIVIGSRYYLAVNPKADAKLTAMAKDFISWLYEDEAGKTAYSSGFGSVPHSFGYFASENPSNAGSETESGTVSPENAEPSGILDNSSQSAESGAKNGMRTGENSAEVPEEETVVDNPTPVPSHNIESALMRSVAEYYAKGDWVPDMSTAFPEGWAEDVLGAGLSDFFGMETWSDEDRKNFSDTLMGGWKDRLNKG